MQLIHLYIMKHICLSYLIEQVLCLLKVLTILYIAEGTWV